MSDGPSIHDQHEHQRALARLQRQHQRADGTLDRAEVRHNAIWSVVWAARFWAPFGVTVLFAGVGSGGEIWLASVIAVLAIYFVANLAGVVAGSLLGAFHPTIAVTTENIALVPLGGMMALVGAGYSFGTFLGGAAIACMPFVWTIWARGVVRNTDYARLRSAQDDEGPPRIME